MAAATAPRTVPIQQPASPPPFDVPASHFAAGLVWLALGIAGLVVIAPVLARGEIFAPRAFAVTHAISLGFLTTIIFGALHQLFPALLGVGMRSARVARAGFWLLQAGVAALVAGFWFWWPALQGIGWLFLFGAVGVVSWNLLPQRRRARQNRLVGRYISAGHSALGVAMFLGLARIGESLGWWHFDRMGTIAAHFHLAALGFATLTAVGVGSRIIPMFLGAQDAPNWQLRWIGPVAGAGLAVFATGAVAGWASVRLPGAVLLALSAVLYLHLVAGYFRHRTNRGLDPALGHVAASFGFLALTLGVGVLLLTLPGFHPGWWAAYAVLGLVGWLGTLTVGVLYRILAFLSWLHLFGGRSRTGSISAPDLTKPTWAWTSLGLWAGGLLVMAAGLWLGQPGMARIGSAGMAGAVGLVAAQVARALRMRPAGGVVQPGAPSSSPG